MDHYTRLQRMYVAAPLNQFFRPAISIAEGTAQVRLQVRPDMFHAAHALHGSVYFKMLDDAAFFAVQSLVTEVFVVTASFSLHLLAPVTDGEMVATGRAVHASKRLFIGESLVEVGGRVVARGSGSFMRSTVRLDDRIGY